MFFTVKNLKIINFFRKEKVNKFKKINENPEKKYGKFDDLDFDSIECISQVFKDLIWKENKAKTIITIIVFIIGSFFLLFPVGEKIDILSLLTLVPIAYFAYFFHKARTFFISKFAEKNKLKYQFSIPLNEVKGSLFKVEGFKKIRHVVEGSFKGQKARFFYYNCGDMDNHITVLEIFFEKTEFPYIFLKSKKMHKIIQSSEDIKINKNNIIKINLGDNFEKHYNLFVRDGYGVEVMQIFNPEFLEFLIKEKDVFSIEFSNNRMYVYDNDIVRKKEQLENIFNVTKEIIDKIGPLLNRLENDFTVLHKYYKN